MVLYYNDINIPHKINDWLIPIILLVFIILPILIYLKFYKESLIITIFIAVMQIIALGCNFAKYPL